MHVKHFCFLHELLNQFLKFMESYVLEIFGRNHGSLLQNKTFVPLEGPVLTISNSSSFTSTSFSRAAWDKTGSKIAASDCFGNIYVFNLHRNRFYLVCRLNTSSSFLVFSSDRTQDILVALTDCTIISLSSESKCIQKKFCYHTSCVTNISFDKSGFSVLSCSKDEAILWSLTSFSILRILTLKKNVDIVKVFFLSNKGIIVSAFKDSSVFLWDFKNFTCTSQFLCKTENTFLNVKTLDGSSDGKLLACAGKADWLMVWDVDEDKKLFTISLSPNMSVKQINFLPSVSSSNESYILSLLSSDGQINVYNLKSVEHLYNLTSSSGKIISFANSLTHFQLAVISVRGNLELYDIENFVLDVKKDLINKQTVRESHYVPEVASKVAKERVKDKKIVKKIPDLDKKQITSVVKNFEEYPEKYRFFIWSQLLDLPRNEDAFNILYQESFNITMERDYSFMNPGMRNTFVRIISMLICWYPVIKYVEHFQCIVFPFVKVLHKNRIMCFEVLVTLISNWCQNWFLFCPFPPFNILCVVENIISFHDKELMLHFTKNNITPEVFAWPLLQTSFSEVFNKKQWLKLWDNILSNSLSFLLYSVAAFNIVLRHVLLQCNTLDQFKECYNKHGISASALIRKAYHLQQTSSSEINPEAVIGHFSAIPKGAYPTFIQMSEMKVDLETHERKILIDQEINFLQQRENILEIKSSYLMELQKLQILRRKMYLDSMEVKDVDSLDKLDKKLKKIQGLIQGNLTDQISMLKRKIGDDLLSGQFMDDEHHFFRFRDYMKKLKVKNQHSE